MAKRTSGWSCQDCGKKFATIKAAEKAMSVGCPKCGASDVDLDPRYYNPEA